MKARHVVLAALALSAVSVDAETQAPPPPATAPVAQNKGAIIQRIIVKVNGEIFTQTDLEARQVEALQDQNRQVKSPQDLQNDAVLAKALAEVTPTILIEVVDELLLVQRGREIGATFTDALFNTTIENIKKTNKFDDAMLKQALAQSGMTMNDLRTRFERRYLIESVQRNEIMRNMQVTDEEARQYYKAHPELFKKPATIMLRELFVEVPVATKGGQPVFSAAEQDDAKAKAEAARARALKGEDFATIVAEVSDAGSKANGGLIGPVVINELAEALAKVIETLKPGQYSEIIRTARGFMFFKLESRSEEAVEPFDSVREDVINRIGESRLDSETQKHIEKLRAQALIEWKDEQYRVMYENAVKAARGK
jgi:peptidyl-prolyl cis-trans isomerase SurA